jgi:two-component system sensor histidine kinase RegB
MQVSVTDHRPASHYDLRPTGELAPTLVLPWLVRFRYGIIAGKLFVLILATLFLHVRFAVAWLAIPFTIDLLSNLLLRAICTRIGARRGLGGALVLDVLTLTCELALAGGPANPLSLLYLVQITLSAVVLSKTWTWSLGSLSVLGFASLFYFHLTLPILEGHHPVLGFSAHLVGMWIAFVTVAILITVLVSKVSDILRNHELEMLRLQSLLDRQEKVASLATLAAGAAHEMGTPLATIAVSAREVERYAQKSHVDGFVAEEAGLIRAQVERCGKILREMSAHGAELVAEAASPIEVSALLEQVRNSFSEPRKSAILTEAVAGVAVVLPIEATRQVLAALVKNALDASIAGQQIALACEEKSGQLRFTVRDFGHGMSSKTLVRLGEPFFTTKGPESGMGLGTFLVRAYAENLGGKLLFDSAIGKGTTAVLELPIGKPAGK